MWKNLAKFRFLKKNQHFLHFFAKKFGSMKFLRTFAIPNETKFFKDVRKFCAS